MSEQDTVKTASLATVFSSSHDLLLLRDVLLRGLGVGECDGTWRIDMLQEEGKSVVQSGILLSALLVMIEVWSSGEWVWPSEESVLNSGGVVSCGCRCSKMVASGKGGVVVISSGELVSAPRTD